MTCGSSFNLCFSKTESFQAHDSLLNIPIWTEVMKSRAPGVEIGALPAVRASEASDFKISFIYCSDANSNRQRLLPFPLPKLLSQINAPRRQTVFIVVHSLHFADFCFPNAPPFENPKYWMDGLSAGWVDGKKHGVRIRKN